MNCTLCTLHTWVSQMQPLFNFFSNSIQMIFNNYFTLFHYFICIGNISPWNWNYRFHVTVSRHVCGCWESNLGPPEEQPVIPTTELHLSSTLRLSVEGTVHHGREGMAARAGGRGCIASTDRKQREMNADAHLTSRPYSVQTYRPQNSGSHLGWVFPPQLT